MVYWEIVCFMPIADCWMDNKKMLMEFWQLKTFEYFNLFNFGKKIWNISYNFEKKQWHVLWRWVCNDTEITEIILILQIIPNLQNQWKNSSNEILLNKMCLQQQKEDLDIFR